MKGRTGIINGITVLIIGMALVFQEICFIKAIGNSYLNSFDNQLAGCNIEHWYLWIKGVDHFFTTGQLYPIANNVGFLDMMMVFAPFYALARIFVGHAASCLISLVVVHLLGSVGVYYLNKRVFGFSLSATVISVFLFSFSNSLQIVGHVYLLSISLAPWFCAFCIQFTGSMESGEVKFRYLMAAISLFALICYSAVYVAQFLVIFIAFVALFLWIHNFCNQTGYSVRKVILKSIKDHLGGYIICAVYAILTMIPFAYAYFPILKENRGYNAAEQLLYSPILSDLLNVGPNNLLYGEVMAQLGMRGYTVGFPLITFLSLLGTIFSMIRYADHNKKDFLAGFYKACAISICITVALIIKIDDQFNLWSMARILVPGFSSMRAMVRFIPFLLFPLSVISGAFLDRLFSQVNAQPVRCMITVIIVLLFIAENANKVGIGTIDWGAVVKDIDVAEMPEDCKAFFVYDSHATEEELADHVGQNYKADVLAFRIANKYGVRTLNGIGSVFPYDTYTLFDVYGDGYLGNIVNWIARYELTGIYGYDIETGAWAASNEMLSSYVISEGFSFREDNDGEIWYWATDLTSEIQIFNFSDQAENINFSFATAVAPDGNADGMDIYIGEEFVRSAQEGETIDLDLQMDANSSESIRIVSNGDLCTVENDARTFAYRLINPTLKAR